MIKDCPFLNRNIKLLPCQKDRVVRLHKQGWNNYMLAWQFNVSRQLIILTIHPDRLERARMQRLSKGSRYYKTQENSQNIKNHRAYLKELGLKKKK